MPITLRTGCIDPTKYGAFGTTDQGRYISFSRVGYIHPSHWDNATGLRKYRPVHSYYYDDNGEVAGDTIDVRVEGDDFEDTVNIDSGDSEGWIDGNEDNQRAVGLPASGYSGDNSSKPRIITHTVYIEGNRDAASSVNVLGEEVTDNLTTAYDGQPWHKTGRFNDTAFGSIGANEWTFYEANRACSAYLMQYLLGHNFNKAAYETRQRFSYPIVRPYDDSLA